MLLKLFKADFLGNPDCRISTKAFLPFLAFVGRLVGFLKIIQFALLVGADSNDVRSECMSIGVMPLSFKLYWSCHIRGHIRSI